MRVSLKIIEVLIIIVSLIFVIVLSCIVFNEAYFNWGGKIDVELAGKFGDFLGGFVGTLFGFLSICIVAYSILKQTNENHKNNIRTAFFQMIDYHYRNVEQLEVPKDNNCQNKEKQRRGFVVFKIQYKRLLQALLKINTENELGLDGHDIAAIAYMVFYYGLDESWEKFLENKIECYDCRTLLIKELKKLSKLNPEMTLCRTNQTMLSAYFRNMYNAIRMIDEDSSFSLKEKKGLIRIYRAQLSNPELYIMFFNLVSPFGKKWIEKDYVQKYGLLKNIPFDYLDGYSAKDYFPISYENDEIKCGTTDPMFQNKPLPNIPSSTKFQCKPKGIIVPDSYN